MMNLAEGLIQELNRNRELLSEYKAIGPPGQFGATMIALDIKNAEKTQASGDVVEMLRCYESLKNNE